MSTSRKHVTSSLSCRHLPSVGDATQLTLTAKAFDGAVEFQSRLSAVSAPNTPKSPASDCFDWLLPVGEFTSGSGPSRTRFAKVGDELSLDFSFLFLCNRSLDVIRLSWEGELSANSSTMSDVVDFLFATPNSTGSPRCSEQNSSSFSIIDNVTATCRSAPLLPDDGSYAYYVNVELPVVGPQHAGTFSVEFGTGSSSVVFRVELVVRDRPSFAPFRLRMRTCSNSTWVGTSAVAEYRLRQLVPDCVRCEASGSAAVGVDLLRSDGLILGSEDAHSVYWYRDGGGRSHVAVLLLRAPSDDYSADYYCVATAPETLRLPKFGGEKKRHVARKCAQRIRFRLSVQ